MSRTETLACVPFILREGPERFAGLGTPRQGGTRLFSVCGHVNRPGLYEAPVCVTLRELIEGYAQGVRRGRRLKAVIPGGISAKVLTAKEIDVAMDFDSLTLYGFADDDKRALFELLQTANGVGPKLAQTMLAVHSPRELRRAIATSDFPALTHVPGIGRKGAERIVIELRDRIGSIDGGEPAVVAGDGVTAVAPWRDQLSHALAGLGFSGKEAADAIDAVAPDASDGAAADVPALLRKSIQLLGRTP